MVTANQLHVSASNRSSSGCTSEENGWGLYNIQCNFTLYIVQPPQPFVLDVQPDDGLLEAETQYGPVLRRGYVLEYLFVNQTVAKSVLFKWFNP